jgi:dihydroorotase-like cyclic amidohydrolase
MRRKGRGAAGADADIAVFDPATITGQATYSASTRTPAGRSARPADATRKAHGVAAHA